MALFSWKDSQGREVFLEADAVERIQDQRRKTMTEHVTETGATITDHLTYSPDSLQLTLLRSQTPVSPSVNYSLRPKQIAIKGGPKVVSIATAIAQPQSNRDPIDSTLADLTAGVAAITGGAATASTVGRQPLSAGAILAGNARIVAETMKPATFPTSFTSTTLSLDEEQPRFVNYIALQADQPEDRIVEFHNRLTDAFDRAYLLRVEFMGIVYDNMVLTDYQLTREQNAGGLGTFEVTFKRLVTVDTQRNDQIPTTAKVEVEKLKPKINIPKIPDANDVVGPLLESAKKKTILATGLDLATGTQ